MKKAAIIHGTKGSPEGNWFQSVAGELEAGGFRTFIPQFPTPEGQTLTNWLRHFGAEVGQLDAQSLLIGHSVGAVFALRLLETLKTPISTVVLVSGFTGALGLPDYDALNASFVAGSFDWAHIRAHAENVICLNGDNDPYVPFEQGQEIADSLGVENCIVENGGHLNAEFGFTSFPRLLEELRKAGGLAS
jgi:predicted alpha/beta hydrolase family esterase